MSSIRPFPVTPTIRKVYEAHTVLGLSGHLIELSEGAGLSGLRCRVGEDPMDMARAGAGTKGTEEALPFPPRPTLELAETTESPEGPPQAVGVAVR